MKDTITLEELRKTELYRKEQTRPLRELLKQEPVAYVNNMCNDSIDWIVDPMKLDEGTPLYTAPRELSDEEILEVCLDGGYVDCIADVDLEIDGLEELKHQYLRLCRAILKKASEK